MGYFIRREPHSHRFSDKALPGNCGVFPAVCIPGGSLANRLLNKKGNGKFLLKNKEQKAVIRRHNGSKEAIMIYYNGTPP
jgi:hypothetical protein